MDKMDLSFKSEVLYLQIEGHFILIIYCFAQKLYSFIYKHFKYI